MNAKNRELVELSAEIESKFRELTAEGASADETPYKNWDGDYKDHLVRMQVLAKGENVPDGDVPRHTYFLMCGEKIIGRSEIRRKLNRELEIIEKCGGVFDKEIIRDETGTLISHYWIEL